MSPGIIRAIYGCLQWDPGLLRRLLTTQRTIWQAARAASFDWQSMSEQYDSLYEDVSARANYRNTQ